MSIEKIDRNMYELTCNHCEETVDESFDSFQDAVQYKKDNEWKSVKDKDDAWQDLCPSCQSPDIIRKLKGAD